MGRPTREQELKRAERWVSLFGEIIESADSLIKLGTKEGLWVGLQLDLLLVSGEVHSDDGLLFPQREALIGMLDMVKKLTLKEVPVISDINPLNVLYKFIEPLHIALRIKVSETGGPVTMEVPDLQLDFGDVSESFFSPFLALLKAKEVIEGEPIGTKTVTLKDYYYLDIGIPQRILIALIVPGILRLLFNFLSQSSVSTVL